MRLLLVALLGAAGSVSRYLLGLLLQGQRRFPVGTLAVNLLGSLAIGVVMVIFLRRGTVDGTARIAVTTGFLGGFTTYSAFAYDTVSLWERAPISAAAYVAATVLGGIGACAAGVALARAI